MMEKLGQAKTHLELKKMIAEVDKTNSGKRTTVTTLCLHEQIIWAIFECTKQTKCIQSGSIVALPEVLCVQRLPRLLAHRYLLLIYSYNLQPKRSLDCKKTLETFIHSYDL